MEENLLAGEIAEDKKVKDAEPENFDELDTTDLLCQDDSVTRRMRHLLEDDVDSLNASRPLLLSNNCFNSVSVTSDLGNAMNLLEKVKKDNEVTSNADDDHSDVRITSPLQTAPKYYDEKISVHTSDDIFPTDPVTEYLFSEPRLLQTYSSGIQLEENQKENHLLSEDSMELSDSTEYSDLPKLVIDKPRTLLRKEVGLTGDSNGENIDPATDRPAVEFQKTSKVDCFHGNEPDSQIKVAWTENSSADKLCSDSELTDKIQISEYSAMRIHGDLDDKKLLDKVKRAVAEEKEQFSEDSMKETLKDEPSNVSTVDSLAVQVRDLLQEEKSLMNEISKAGTGTETTEDISRLSNLSAEIGNFEKTELWKYTRQFLPGITMSRPTFLPRSAFANSLNGVTSLNETSLTNNSQVDGSPGAKYSSYKWDSPLPAKPESKINSLMQNDALQRERQKESEKKADAFPLSPQLHSYSTKKSRQTCVVGRYSNHTSGAAAVNESTLHESNYKILLPDESIMQTPNSFITPRRVGFCHEKVPTVTYSPEKTSTPMKINTTQKSAYFGNSGTLYTVNKTAGVDGNESRATRNSVNSIDHSPSLYSRNLSGNFKSSRFSSKDSEERYTPLQTMAQRDTFQTNRHMNGVENHKEVPDVDINGSKKYGSEFLHSASTNVPLTTSSRPMLEPKISKSPLHHLEFVTPLVRKSTLRPSAGIPLYDQLPEEVKNGGEQRERNSDEETVTSALISPKVREDGFPVIKENSLPKEYKHIPSYSDSRTVTASNTSSSGPVKYTKDYKVLTIHTRDLVSPVITHVEDSEKKINDLEAVSPRSNDNDLHRRTVSPVSPSERGKFLYKVPKVLSPYNPSESDGDLCKTLGSKQNDILSPTAVGNISGTVDHSDNVQIEPAPLPYVHLSTRRAEKSHEISMEKVQSLLRKEKNGGVQPRPDTVTSPLVPKCNEEFSSDDDLVERLRTISKNTPVIEELLQKLYARSIENKQKFEQAGQSRMMRIKGSVNRAIQTDQNIEACDYSNLSSAEDSQGARRTKPHRLYAEASCQTSLMDREKSIEKMHKQLSEKKKVTIGKPREKHPHVNRQIKDKYDYQSPVNDYMKVQSKKPCAFFIDMSGVKEEPPPETRETRMPVAWYEPYQYLPPWKIKESVLSDGALKPEQLNVQDAFLKYKQKFAIRSWERQENIAIRAEERKILDREKKANRLYDEETNKKKHLRDRQYEFDPIALQHERQIRRELLWKEMKLMNKQKYERLPEVMKRKREEERKKYYAANRERALEYKRKITSLVVQRWKMKTERLVH